MKRKVTALKAGFTLLDVFLAVVVLAIAFSGVAAGIAMSRKNLTIARINRMAIELADNRLEYYKAQTPASEGSVTETLEVGSDAFDMEYDFTLVENSRTRSGGKKLDYQCYLVRVSVDHDYLHQPVALETLVDYREAP